MVVVNALLDLTSTFEIYSVMKVVTVTNEESTTQHLVQKVFLSVGSFFFHG